MYSARAHLQQAAQNWKWHLPEEDMQQENFGCFSRSWLWTWFAFASGGSWSCSSGLVISQVLSLMSHGSRPLAVVFTHNNDGRWPFFMVSGCALTLVLRFREVEFGNSANHELNIRADDEANPCQKQRSAGRVENVETRQWTKQCFGRRKLWSQKNSRCWRQRLD